MIITGAARGLGRACALRFADEGADLLLAALRRIAQLLLAGSGDDLPRLPAAVAQPGFAYRGGLEWGLGDPELRGVVGSARIDLTALGGQAERLFLPAIALAVSRYGGGNRAELGVLDLDDGTGEQIRFHSVDEHPECSTADFLHRFEKAPVTPQEPPSVGVLLSSDRRLHRRPPARPRRRAGQPRGADRGVPGPGITGAVLGRRTTRTTLMDRSVPRHQDLVRRDLNAPTAPDRLWVADSTWWPPYSDRRCSPAAGSGSPLGRGRSICVTDLHRALRDVEIADLSCTTTMPEDRRSTPRRGTTEPSDETRDGSRWENHARSQARIHTPDRRRSVRVECLPQAGC